jgi:hypothetical protein
MTDALQTADLPPEAVEFIRGGSPKPQTQAPVLPEVATAKQPVEPKPVSKPRKDPEKAPDPVVLVALGFRVPLEISQALLKISSERKLKRLRPFTQQEIVAEALSEWIKKNGVADK